MNRILQVLLLSSGVAIASGSIPGTSTVESTDSVDQTASGSFTDGRDGETYRWVRLGNQVWMAENLRFAAGDGCWAWNDDEATVAERGRYYDWAAAQRAAPPGWHLPSDEEWKQLEMFLGLSREEVDRVGTRGISDRVLAGRLKARGRWHTEYEGRPVPVTDETGFSALPIGWRNRDQFLHEGYTAFWSGSEVGDQAWLRGLQFFDDTITRLLNNKVFAFSVRCVRDP